MANKNDASVKLDRKCHERAKAHADKKGMKLNRMVEMAIDAYIKSAK